MSMHRLGWQCDRREQRNATWIINYPNEFFFFSVERQRERDRKNQHDHLNFVGRKCICLAVCCWRPNEWRGELLRRAFSRDGTEGKRGNLFTVYRKHSNTSAEWRQTHQLAQVRWLQNLRWFVTSFFSHFAWQWYHFKIWLVYFQLLPINVICWAASFLLSFSDFVSNPFPWATNGGQWA